MSTLERPRSDEIAAATQRRFPWAIWPVLLGLFFVPVAWAQRVAAVAAGSDHSLFLLSDGTLWGMGGNGLGQLGDGTRIDRPTPVLMATRVTAVAAGAYHTLFLQQDGSLWGAGWNSCGQLGDGTRVTRLTPVRMASGVRVMSAGVLHSMFITVDGGLWAMGSNASGQLGDGTVTDHIIPYQVWTGVAAVAAGGYYSVFCTTAGELWAMGANDSGQLGTGPEFEPVIAWPRRVGIGVAAVAAGGATTMFRTTDDSLWAMGLNTYGGLGDGTQTDRHVPRKIADGVDAFAVGGYHSLFTKKDGTLWVCGYNLDGELGDGSTISRPVPVAAGTAVALAAGSRHSLLVSPTGELRATGGNGSGQLGDGTVTNRLRPVIVPWPVLSGNTPPRDLRLTNLHVERTAGEHAMVGTLVPGDPDSATFSYALVGGEGDGQNLLFELEGASLRAVRPADLPVGTCSIRVQVRDDAGGTLTKVFGISVASGAPAVPTALAGGNGHCLWRLSNGELWGVGANADNQLGNFTFASPPAPILVARDVATVAGGGGHTVYTTMDGVVLAIGSDYYGQLGASWPGTLSKRDHVLVATGMLGTGVEAVAAGDFHSLALTWNGVLMGFGRNEKGEIGQVALGSSLSLPWTIAKGVVACAAGGGHTLFLTVDGSLWGLGANSRGQLGFGTADTGSHGSPLAVATEVMAMAAGGSHTLFVKRDGTLWGMGQNSDGQIGDGTTSDRALPVQIASDVVAVDGGIRHSVFLKADGSLWTMGSNASGQLADGSTQASRVVPVLVAQGVSVMAAGGAQTLYLTEDGRLWSAGSANAWLPNDGTPISQARLITTATADAVTITGQPASASAAFDRPVSLQVAAIGVGHLNRLWERNGLGMPSSNSRRFSLDHVGPEDAGLYTAVVSDGGSSARSLPAIVAITTTTKVVGGGQELTPVDIRHPNGNVFDQVLLTGAAEAITADYDPNPAKNQITRTSFVDLDDDIVQVEFSGPGTLSLVLDNATGPALPVNYNQATTYMKGHAGIVIAGATEQTNVSVFSVGKVTAVNQALFKDGVKYDGIADIAFIAILSSNGKFGGVRTANANYFAAKGLTGLYAPGVAFQGPVFIGNITAFDAATPVIQVGAVGDARITGGDLAQANGAAVQVSGILQLKFTAGGDSHGNALPAQANKAVLKQDGVDVTAEVVAAP